MTDDTQTTPNTNPFQRKWFVLLGDFSTPSLDALHSHLRVLGAIPQDSPSSITDIIVLGDNAPRILPDDTNSDVWDEPRLLAELGAYANQLEQHATADKFDTTHCVAQPTTVHGGMVDKVLGLSVLEEAIEEIHGHAYAYIMTRYGYDPVWNYKNVETLQALVLHELSEEQMQDVIDHADRFPQLKALLILEHDHLVPVDQLLEKLPQLKCLYVTESKLQFGVLRHHHLEQIHLHETSVLNFAAASFSQLRYLHYSIDFSSDNINQIAPEIAKNAFPQLIHLGLESWWENHVEHLLQLGPNLNIQSLTLGTIASVGDDQEHVETARAWFEELANWSGAKNLTRVTCSGNKFFFSDKLLKNHFPELTHLILDNVYEHGYETDETFVELERLTICSGLHLAIKVGLFEAEDFTRFHQVLANKPSLASLDLRGSTYMNDDAINLLRTLPYPVYLDDY